MRMKMNSPLLIMWEWITRRIEALLSLYDLIKFRIVKVSGNWMKGRKTPENCSFQLVHSGGEGILDGGFCFFIFSVCFFFTFDQLFSSVSLWNLGHRLARKLNNISILFSRERFCILFNHLKASKIFQRLLLYLC